VARLEKNRDVSRHPLSDVGFTLESVGVRRQMSGGEHDPGLEMESYFGKDNICSQDLILLGYEGKKQVTFDLKYGKKLFKPETIAGYIDAIKSIVTSVIENPLKTIKEIVCMSMVEAHHIRTRLRQAREGMDVQFDL